MSGLTENNKIHTAELKLYRCLGVRSFRKLILTLEGIKHSKDKGRNINYHIRDKEISSAKSYTGYLLYNTTCHLLSLVLILILYVFTFITGKRYPVFDISMAILAVLDLYCIMLQRYTYIKLHKYIEKYTAVRKRQIGTDACSLAESIIKKSKSEINEEYAWILDFSKHVGDGKDFIIEQKDVSVLNRISTITGTVLNKRSGSTKNGYSEETLSRIIEKIPKRPLIIEKVEQRSSFLQNVIRSERRSNTLFGFCVVTESLECEKAFNRLFPNSSRDSVEYVTDVLLEAYTKCI